MNVLSKCRPVSNGTRLNRLCPFRALVYCNSFDSSRNVCCVKPRPQKRLRPAKVARNVKRSRTLCSASVLLPVPAEITSQRQDRSGDNPAHSKNQKTSAIQSNISKFYNVLLRATPRFVVSSLEPLLERSEGICLQHHPFQRIQRSAEIRLLFIEDSPQAARQDLDKSFRGKVSTRALLSGPR